MTSNKLNAVKGIYTKYIPVKLEIVNFRIPLLLLLLRLTYLSNESTD